VEKDRSKDREKDKDKKQIKISGSGGTNSGGTSTPTKLLGEQQIISQHIHTQLEAVLAERRKKT